MMAAAEIIRTVAEIGGVLEPETPTRLRYRLPADYPPELLELLKENAAEVLRLLRPLSGSVQ